jgi:DNA polymerase-3 subunit gamma/tau
MSPTEHGPCGECEVCINLSSDSNMDIFEIDAASNNGVDEIRDLRDKVRFPPAIGRYKVYIIDEVHMLSIGAFNALLKTLEEPPAHAVFILATTEPHKLPATILSRCQRYNFKRIPQKVMVERMQAICSSMNISVEESGLHTIARWAEGGMRDALSLLDQCMSFCGSHITNDEILAILGTADQGFLFQAADDILVGNLQGLLHKIGRILDDGKDLTVFLRDLLHHMRNLLIVKACSNPENLLDAAGSTLDRLRKQAEGAGEARLIRSIEVLSPLESEMRYSSQPRILMELAAVRLCRPEEEVSLEALKDRVEYLEKRLKNGAAAITDSSLSKTQEYDIPYAVTREQSFDPAMDASLPPVPPDIQDDNGTEEDLSSLYNEEVDKKSSDKTESQSSKKVKPEEKKAAANAPAANTGTGSLIAAWPDILEIISRERPSIHVILADARPLPDKKGVLSLVFPPSLGFHVMLIEQENNCTFIEETVEKVTGTKVRVKCLLEDQLDEQAAAADDDYVVKRAIEVFGEHLVEVVEEE